MIRNAFRLLIAFILRPLRHDRLRTAMTILAVALGVGVVIAIELAGEAAAGSFESSLQTLLGKTDLEVTANGSVDEIWAAKLATIPRAIQVSPVIETVAIVPRIGSVTLYGLDPLSAETGWGGRAPEPGKGLPPVVLSSALAKRMAVSKGLRVSLQINDRTQELQVEQVVDAGSAEFVALDIADAQRLLDRYGQLDRIDIRLDKGEDFQAVEREIRAMLPDSYDLERPGLRSRENQRMLGAFRWNLRVLSYISLVVGAFLIYNTIAVSVVRRRAEIGVLRSLGTSRSGVLALFLGEALLLGFAGSLLGVGLGRVLAEGAVGLIAATVNSLYASSRPAPIELSWVATTAGVFAGMLVALGAALAPALEAMSVSPVSAMARGGHEHQGRLRWRRDLGIGAALALFAWAASQAPPVDGRPLWGYVSALSGIAAAGMAAPAFVLVMDRLSRPLVRRLLGVEGLLAGRGLAAALPRTAVMTGALATAIAMMASVGIMVGSFRETVMLWLDSQLRADLYVRPAGRDGAGQFAALSPAVEALVQSTPGVADMDTFSAVPLRYEGRRATLGAGNMDIVRRRGRLVFTSGDRDAILRSLPGADRAIVSEPFANKHGIRRGDRVRVPIGARQVELKIAGIYYDYSSELGWVIVDRSTLLRYLPHQSVTNLAIYLSPEADAEAVRRRIQSSAAQFRVTVARNRDLRQGAVVIFDRTFAITYALEAVAILVAMLGAANSLLALVLDRRREFGMLRFLGAAPDQLRRMILMEAGFVGVLGCLLGLILGLALSLLLIYVVNKQSFGWTIQFHPPVAMLAAALGLIWLVTVLAGLYPARVASRLNPIEAVHIE